MRVGHVLTVAVTGCAAVPGCGPSDAPPVAEDPAEVQFPAGFMWGSATSAFQVEKGDGATDWGAWVKLAGRIKGGDDPDVGGPDALAHLADDVRALVESGQNAYRFSISWGRLYPTRAAFDADTPDLAAIAAYEELIDRLRAAGVRPMVTLHHFATPTWLSDPTRPREPQAFEREETVAAFAEFAGRVARRFGAKVDWWCTLNEPLNLALGGYIQGGFPPGVALDGARTIAVVRNEARAHALAYDAVKAQDRVDADGDGVAAWVGPVMHQRTFHPLDAGDPDDVAATARTAYVWNRWFLDAVVRGDWDDDLDQRLDGPADRRADPGLAGRADYVGINYYSDTLISAHRGIRVPVIDAAVLQDHLPTARPKTDFAWDVHPEGLGAVVDEAKGYGRPLVITENGLADASDRNRPRFLLEHLYQLGWAIQRGADVRGYFHWALVDNFEWSSGFCPHFGLYSLDRATGARTPRASVEVYRQIIQAGKVTRERVTSAPPYTTPAAFCP